MITYCAECGFPAEGDHPVCDVMFCERQAADFARRSSDPEVIVSAAYGRLLLGALEELPLDER